MAAHRLCTMNAPTASASAGASSRTSIVSRSSSVASRRHRHARGIAAAGRGGNRRDENDRAPHVRGNDTRGSGSRNEASREQIWVATRLSPARERGPMDPVDAGVLDAGRGLRGSANYGGRRHVTIIAAERWAALTRTLGAYVDPSARRANLMVSGIDLEETRSRVLRVGACRLLIGGETRPCERMEEPKRTRAFRRPCGRTGEAARGRKSWREATSTWESHETMIAWRQSNRHTFRQVTARRRDSSGFTRRRACRVRSGASAAPAEAGHSVLGRKLYGRKC